MSALNPLQCILPPYMLDNMSRSKDSKIRQLAIDNLVASAEARTTRTIVGGFKSLGAATSTTAQGKHRLIYDMKNGPQYALPGKLVRSEGDAKSSDPAVNEAYDFSGATYDFYQKVFGRNSLDDHGLVLKSSVHVGKSFDNAFWNGSQMAYGDGDGVVFQRFTKAIDVVGHELTHGVVSYTSALDYQREPGALNEHFADVFGTIIKQWKLKQAVDKADWLMGDALLIPAKTRRAVRDMANPGTAYHGDPHLGDDPQPAHYSKRYKGKDDNGGVHLNSGIPNRAFYLAATGIGGNSWETAGAIWYKAMQQLVPNSKFADCARITIQIAQTEFNSAVAKHVRDAWKNVGL